MAPAEKVIPINAKVALIACPDYDPERVFAAVRKGIDLLGGISRFVSAADKILLKPNLLFGSAPEKAVTTHPLKAMHAVPAKRRPRKFRRFSGLGQSAKRGCQVRVIGRGQ
jgi:uncharacterized protein (DUF362 family)